MHDELGKDGRKRGWEFSSLSTPFICLFIKQLFSRGHFIFRRPYWDNSAWEPWLFKCSHSKGRDKGEETLLSASQAWTVGIRGTQASLSISRKLLEVGTDGLSQCTGRSLEIICDTLTSIKGVLLGWWALYAITHLYIKQQAHPAAPGSSWSSVLTEIGHSQEWAFVAGCPCFWVLVSSSVFKHSRDDYLFRYLQSSCFSSGTF